MCRGGAETVQQYVREARREDARHEARRAARRAVREAVRRAARAGLIVHVDRMAIDCAMMCTGCGWLRWPDDPTAGDPQRRTPASSDSPMCPHCGSRAWLDLQHVPTWDALQQVERYEAEARRGRPIGVAVGVA